MSIIHQKNLLQLTSWLGSICSIWWCGSWRRSVSRPERCPSGFSGARSTTATGAIAAAGWWACASVATATAIVSGVVTDNTIFYSYCFSWLVARQGLEQGKYRTHRILIQQQHTVVFCTVSEVRATYHLVICTQKACSLPSSIKNIYYLYLHWLSLI